MCGELLVSMYGARPAANNWQKYYTTVMTENGFRRIRACTCMFRHPERDMGLMVRGDDCVSPGDQEDVVWFKELLESSLKLARA